MTDVLNAGDPLFSQPEGAGGFGDDPVPWITAGGSTWDDDYRQGVRELLQARRDYPALCAGGTRTVLPTTGGPSLYAFLRETGHDDVPAIVALNFSANPIEADIDLSGRGYFLQDVRTSERFAVMGDLPIILPAYGYALYAVDAELARCDDATSTD